MSQLLTFENVEFHDEGEVIFGPVSGSFPTTGITSVVGPNGSGKSLFLELAHGLIQPSKGRILWGDDTPQETRRKRGYIFQNPTVMRRSVLANLRFAMAHIDITSKERATRISELLDLINLRENAKRPAALLSGGQLQALALGRALAISPESLLMDEPTSSLDPQFSAHFEAIIAQLTMGGMSVFWTTHDLFQARRISRNVIIVAEGQVAEAGAANDVLRNPQSAAARKFLEGTF